MKRENRKVTRKKVALFDHWESHFSAKTDRYVQQNMTGQKEKPSLERISHSMSIDVME